MMIGKIERVQLRDVWKHEARDFTDSLKRISEQRYVTPRVFANVHAGLDSLDAAMGWLMRAAETRAPGVNLHIRHPFRDKIRDHPRYPELLRLIRLDR
jgi:hypothetical protein